MLFNPRFSPLLAPWTCRSCLQRSTRALPTTLARRSIRTRSVPVKPKNKRRRRILLATTGIIGTAAAGAVAISDEAKHYAAAAQRTGRVVTTLAICVNEYA